MGVRKDWPILQTIIQKTLNTITTEEKDAINQRWIQLKYDPGVPLNRILRWSGVIAFGILLSLAVLFLWNRSLKREIRARKIIEKELKTVLETIPSGVCILSDRIIMQCNPAMEAIFGFEPGTLVGRSVRSLYENDETFKEYGSLIYNEIKVKGRFDGEVAYMRQNGELFWARDIGVPIFPERSETYTVFSVTDISQQIKKREMLTLQKEELEATLARIKTLEGIISICMYCKKIRNEDSWEQLEQYITENTDALFSHGICPECVEKEWKS